MSGVPRHRDLLRPGRGSRRDVCRAGIRARPEEASQPKLEPFECGEVPFALPAGRFPVKFYLTAILFILFDVELVFLPVGRGVSRSRCVGPR